MILSKTILCEINSICEAKIDRIILSIKDPMKKTDLQNMFNRAKLTFNNKIPQINWFFEEIYDYSKIDSLTENEWNILFYISKDFLNMFDRFYSYNVPAINNYPLKGNIKEVLKYFRRKKKDWDERFANIVSVEDSKKIRILLKCSNPNFIWFDLEFNECDEDSKALGHCGGDEDATTIWLLREKIFYENKLVGFRPIVTASFREFDKAIIQMKGKGNKKPSEKYHSHIIDLAKSGLFDCIFIENSDYDFHWKDLDDSEIDDVIKNNKNLLEKDRYLAYKYNKKKIVPAVTYWPNGNKRIVQYSAPTIFGELHREDGPAYIAYYNNGNPIEEVWYWHGNRVRHDSDGPAHIEYNRDGSKHKESWCTESGDVMKTVFYDKDKDK